MSTREHRRAGEVGGRLTRPQSDPALRASPCRSVTCPAAAARRRPAPCRSTARFAASQLRLVGRSRGSAGRRSAARLRSTTRAVLPVCRASTRLPSPRYRLTTVGAPARSTSSSSARRRPSAGPALSRPAASAGSRRARGPGRGRRRAAAPVAGAGPTPRSSRPVCCAGGRVDDPQDTAADGDDPPAVGLDQVGLVGALLVHVGAGEARGRRPARRPLRAHRPWRPAPPGAAAGRGHPALPGRPYGPTAALAALRRSARSCSQESKATSRNAAAGVGRRRGRAAAAGVARPVRQCSRRAGGESDDGTSTGGATSSWDAAVTAAGFRRQFGAGTGVGHLDQPGQHHHAAGGGDERLGAQPFERLLEVPDVGGAQVHQRVGLARDRVGADHLGVPPGGHGDLGRAWSGRCRTARRTPRWSSPPRPAR